MLIQEVTTTTSEPFEVERGLKMLWLVAAGCVYGLYVRPSGHHAQLHVAAKPTGYKWKWNYTT